LKEIGQAIGSMAARNDLANFLENPENAQKLNGLVEDIRYALIDYQVCTFNRIGSLSMHPTSSSDFFPTRNL